MATDAYMFFKDYDGNFLKSESTVELKGEEVKDEANNKLYTPFKAAYDAGGLFEVEDYSFDVEQTLNIGSQSTGAGAGRITFNPFSITRKIDKSSPNFFLNACSGRSFRQVGLGLRKSAGSGLAGKFFLNFRFSLVAVKTLGWQHDEESPKETVTFEYGALMVLYGQQDAAGKIATPIGEGWNRVKNQRNTNPELEIT